MGPKSARITISAGPVSAEAELFVESSESAKLIFDALPVTGHANLWGDEIYFAIPVSCGLGPEARDTVDLGDLGYWPTGKAFCIFFGPTPMSSGSEIVPASAVNVVGRVAGDPKLFKKVGQGEEVVLERAG